jgi:glycosyltransferase involved in cell wall biosynthesis
MRILILTPSAFPALTGNAVTTERWRRSLISRGVVVEVLPSDGSDRAALTSLMQRFRPDIIHVHHVLKGSSILLSGPTVSETLALPLVVSPGGTDINLDFAEPGRRENITQVLTMARVVVTQSLDMMMNLRRQIPAIADKIVNVPKASSWFGDEFYDIRTSAGCLSGDILFLLPAGIRPVKGNLECLFGMERVHQVRAGIRFVSAGPAVDPSYALQFEREIDRLSGFAAWIRAIPHTAMRSVYEASDVILNTSFSEGLSNSLLEAIAAGRPFLASDVPGNRHPALSGGEDMPAGSYFNPCSAEDFVNKAVQLIDDPGFRNSLREAAQLRKRKLPTPEKEADGLIEAYRRALHGNGS